VYFDTGTTTFAVAEAVARKRVCPLRVVTNSLPAADRLSTVKGVEVFLLGGQYLRRQSALLGPLVAKSLSLHQIDLGILSAEGADASGIWNSQEEITEFQRTLMTAARRHMILMDASKLGKKAPALLTSWDAVEMLVTDASPAKLRAAGIPPTVTVRHA
jgi:DeoR family transcriptional regulator of aga operon